MATYTLHTTSLPLDNRWDVIVVGGGPAGCTAATAAAREGAKTLLIEATGCLGGMGTAGLVPAWCPFDDGEKVIYRGLAERVFTACKAGMPHIDANATAWVPIDPELLKRIYDDLVTEAGVTVLFNTMVASVETDDQHGIQALIAGNKAGLTALQAQAYVDCTGDGDLAAWAGAEVWKGEEGTGDLQPASHCFILSNVDEYRLHIRPHTWGSPEHDAMIASGKYPLIPDRHLCDAQIGPATVSFNAGHLWQVDNTDPASVSHALMQGRKIAAAFRDALAEFHPTAYGNAFLVSTASLIGIRETRRIAGDYVLTLQDYLARRSFSDEIARNCYYIDVHHTSQDASDDLAGTFDISKGTHHYQPGESHGIPYRCLTPRGIRNVLVAGRCISTDRPVQGSTRVMPVCLATGEAAGLAAALAAQQTAGDVHAVNTSHLRARLLAEGAYLPDLPVTPDLPI